MERGKIEVVMCQRDRNNKKTDKKVSFSAVGQGGPAWLAKRAFAVASKGVGPLSKEYFADEFFGDKR